MKIRTAKKIMGWNPNSRINMKQFKRFHELRPPHIAEYAWGRKVYPSWHDIDIIHRARTRLYQWIRRFENKQSKQKRLQCKR